jgi:hypothetical protein
VQGGLVARLSRAGRSVSGMTFSINVLMGEAVKDGWTHLSVNTHNAEAAIGADEAGS